MKFEEKYPDAQPGIASTPFIVKSLHEHQQRPCVICREETRWFHRELIEFVCSEECVWSLSVSCN